jgi:hypothetical protein
MTVVCVASGPSLTAADVTFCRGKAFVLAIKDAIRLAPWADALYACDAKWWKKYGDGLDFAGPKYTLDHFAARWATVLRNTGDSGLETDPTGLRTGKNSGYQAINLAVHLGATKIVLLGYDMSPDKADPKKHHWFGAHPWKTTPPYALFLPFFRTLVGPLKALGIPIVNASRRSALTCFPMASLAEALA